MTHMVQNAVEWNCHRQNWNLIGVELLLSELELELNCLWDWVPDSDLEWTCFYQNWNWN